MFTISKIKWIGSLSLSGIILLLALFGGNWGTDYSARASEDAFPTINSINPLGVAAGSDDTILIISGSDLGVLILPEKLHYNSGVSLVGAGFDVMLLPQYISPDQHYLSVFIPRNLLIIPTSYSLTVYTSSKNTIPSLPIWPEFDQPSNIVEFFVFASQNSFLPIISR